jgi:hypothetical protein
MNRPRVRRWWTCAALPIIAAGLAALGGGCATDGGTAAAVRAEGPFAFWPPPPNEPRIQFLRSFRLSSDIEKPSSALDQLLFGSDAQPVPITKPYGVAVWQGRIYVCDISNPAVVILDLEAQQTRLMVTRGVEQMAQPTDIAIAPDGMKYVIDRRRGRIFVFDADDRHVASLGDKGLQPVGIDVYGDELYVADFATQSVLVLDRVRGEQRRTIGGPGGADGEFIRPLGVNVGGNGHVYVGDTIRGCVQQFDPSGAHVRTIGSIGDGPGSFVRPKHMAIDDGILYVVDGAFQNVQMFTTEGELLMFFGGPGPFAGAMSLPAGVTVHGDNIERFEPWVHPAFEAQRLVVVSNQFGPDKIAVYAFGGLREGFTVADVAGLQAPEKAESEPEAAGNPEEGDEAVGPATPPAAAGR